ncbi:hypothetical protein E4T43_01311 [Aureobasidium subglaciale]|nr:hypothetical protein E4T43_01311 [Aureobasidium subglaciale]
MAAAKLCCTAPSRPESPDSMPSRPVRQFKSLANIKIHFAHNKHTPVVADDHSKRSPTRYPADDLELRRIFVTASLPEDHPHALRLQHRKPGVDETIIRSPSFTNKLRRQLSRRSIVTDLVDKDVMGKSKIKAFAYSRKTREDNPAGFSDGYDDDAQSFCLSESRLASLENGESSSQLTRPSGPTGLGTIAPDLRASDFVIYTEPPTISYF